MKTFTALASAFLLPAAIATANNEQQAMENYLNATFVAKCDLLLTSLEKELSPEEHATLDAELAALIPIDELPPRYQNFFKLKNSIDLSLVKAMQLQPDIEESTFEAFLNLYNNTFITFTKVFAEEGETMELILMPRLKELFTKYPDVEDMPESASGEDASKLREQINAMKAECLASIKPLPKVDNSKEDARALAMKRVVMEYQIYQVNQLIEHLQAGKHSNTLQKVSLHQLVKEGKISTEGLGEDTKAFLRLDLEKATKSEHDQHNKAIAELTLYNSINHLEDFSHDVTCIKVLDIPTDNLDPNAPETKNEYLPALQHLLQVEKKRLAELGTK